MQFRHGYAATFLSLCPRVPDILGHAGKGVDSTASNLLKTSLWHKKMPWLKGRKHYYRSISDKQALWIETQILDEEKVKPDPYVEKWLGRSFIHILTGYNVMETIG